MISPTGNKKNNKPYLQAFFSSRASGFTLLELMLVSAIMLVLLAASTPLFKKTYEGLRLTSLRDEIAAVLGFCHEKAVFERRHFRFNIDKNNKTCRILVEDEDEKKFIPLKSRWGEALRISEGIEIETEAEYVDFFPDGRATSASIYLTNREGSTHTIVMEQETGFVKVYGNRK